MNVLVACEFSGVVRDAFRARGHNAISCDLRPSAGPHIQGDVLQVLDHGWDLMVAHPPCTYLSVSGLHWNSNPAHKRGTPLPGSEMTWGEWQTEQALEFALALMNAPIPMVCIENPVGVLSTRVRRPDQTIQPYDFGDDASKKTCLWLTELPLLRPTRRVPGRLVEWKGKVVERWGNQTDSGQNRLGPSCDREAIRSMTYPGIAAAMAEQWG